MGLKNSFSLLRQQGYARDHKRVYRVYSLLKLNLRRKGKQRLPVRNPAPLATPEAMNQSWSTPVSALVDEWLARFTLDGAFVAVML